MSRISLSAFRQNANAWRRNLDPRDPNYLEAPDDEEVDAQAEIEEWAAECDLMNREDYHE